MSGSSATPQPWICDTCRFPIANFLSGYILIDDRRSREVPEYDPDARIQEVALDDRGKVLAAETAQLQVDAAVSYLNDPGVQFSVHHMRCAPPEEAGAFETYVTTSRVATGEQWVAWVSHLAETSWMKKRDVVRAMRFWYTGHGLKIPDDIT